jgi:hypothetical protein
MRYVPQEIEHTSFQEVDNSDLAALCSRHRDQTNGMSCARITLYVPVSKLPFTRTRLLAFVEGLASAELGAMNQVLIQGERGYL